MINKEERSNRRLEKLCSRGVSRVYKGEVPFSVMKRVVEEIQIIEFNHDADSILFFYDLVHQNNLRKSQYCLRGNGASSMICYLLEISHVNPMDQEVPFYYQFLMAADGKRRLDIMMNVDTRILEEMQQMARSYPNSSVLPSSIYPYKNCGLNARLEEATGYYPNEEELKEEALLEYYKKMSYKCNEYHTEDEYKANVSGLPGYEVSNILYLVRELQPETIAELIKVESIDYGTRTWIDNGEDLWKHGEADLRTIIGSREDVYEEMLAYGIEQKDAFEIAKSTRKYTIFMKKSLRNLKN